LRLIPTASRSCWICRDLLVRHNLIRDTIEAPGIWLDWDDVNTRVTQNVIVDSRAQSGGVFMEASDQTNWIDHNVIWNVQGFGFYQQDADGLSVFNNVIGQCSGAAIYMQVCTERPLHGRQVTCKRNDVHGNVLVDNGATVYFQDDENSSDRNVIVDRANPDALAEIRKASGREADSTQLSLAVEVDTRALTLWWSAPDDVDAAGLPTPLRNVQRDAPVALFAVRGS
jgi:hypothetical protein